MWTNIPTLTINGILGGFKYLGIFFQVDGWNPSRKMKFFMSTLVISKLFGSSRFFGKKRNPIWFLHSPMFDSTTKLNKTSKYADFGVITSSLHSQAFMFSTTKSLPTSKRLFFSTCASLIAEWPPLSLLGWVILYWHEIQLFSLNDFQQERET